MRPRGSKAELEARRRRAVKMVRSGRGVSEVARLVGVCSRSVSRWMDMYDSDGEAGLAAKPRKGPEPRLSRDDLAALEGELLKGPRAHGLKTELWTLARVADVIDRRFGVRYHPCHVWKVLRRMRWSAQKPERRAREQDEAAVRGWREEQWPRIKGGPGEGAAA
ncbi:MAG: winged helix-turn-helix domain-containing protein [Planctomycetota bacterium]|jgi:transposase